MNTTIDISDQENLLDVCRHIKRACRLSKAREAVFVQAMERYGVHGAVNNDVGCDNFPEHVKNRLRRAGVRIIKEYNAAWAAASMAPPPDES